MIASAEQLREALVPWFVREARDLPWRRAPTPYAVLVSELMLQQTRVETVIPYFERFLARWPTMEALAAAHPDAVLQAWAGLGYYRRARALQAACRAAVERGGLRADAEELLALPGVGPYTAGAIASIAFGLPLAAVDGNVERVISRVDGRTADPTSKEGRRAISERVTAILAPGVASEVTQGLMELGATVCTPRRPRCDVCPWSAHCVAREAGLAEALPRRRAKKPPLEVWGVAGALVQGGRVLLAQRPPGLLGGLWEPPGDEHAAGVDPVEALSLAWRRRVGLEVEVGPVLGSFVHVFTHRRLTLTVYEVAAASPGPTRGDGSYTGFAWAAREAPDVALSRLAQKALALLRAPPLPLAAERRPVVGSGATGGP